VLDVPRALDPKKPVEARRLRKQGKSLSEIMRALNISYGSAHRFTKGVCPEKERPQEARAKISAVKVKAHEEWSSAVPRGKCDTPGCDRPGCGISYGDCHCGCDEKAPLATEDDRTRNKVRGEPHLYTRRCADTLMAADNGEPLLGALELADLSRIEVTRRAKPRLGKGVVTDLIGLDGYRLGRERCERIVVVLRAAFADKGLDASELTLERLFTYERPANEPPVGERARRKRRRRPPTPPNKRGDGRHFKKAKADAAPLLEEEGWTREQAAEFLIRAPSTVTRYVARGRLPEPSIVKVGALRYKVFDPTAVKLCAQIARTSDDPWSRHMRDPDFVLEWASTHYGKDAERIVAHVQRTKERNRLHARIRVGRGRPKSAGPPSYYGEWARLYAEKMSELDEWFREFGQEHDDRPGQLDIAAAVAEDERGLRYLPDYYASGTMNSAASSCHPRLKGRQPTRS
jgi:hypothetical protein